MLNGLRNNFGGTISREVNNKRGAGWVIIDDGFDMVDGSIDLTSLRFFLLFHHLFDASFESPCEQFLVQN